MLKMRRQSGVTLVELLVVSTVITLIAAISFPVLQIVRQREKENRLKEILNSVRKNAIGLGVPASSKDFQDISFTSEGYRNFIIRKLMNAVGDQTILASEAAHAIASGTQLGTIFPASPSSVINPMGYVVLLATGPNAPDPYPITITQRFIRGIPEHPFKDWFPNAHWEFKAVATDAGATRGPWYTLSATYTEFDIERGMYTAIPWPGSNATGVIDIRSMGAGIALNGSDTSQW